MNASLASLSDHLRGHLPDRTRGRSAHSRRFTVLAKLATLATLAKLAIAPAALAIALAACRSSSPADESPPGLPCDVADVLARRCQSCHGKAPAFGAPMSLTTHAELVAPSKSAPGRRVFEDVGARIHDAARPMPQPPNARLDAADTKVLDTWIARGAPANGDTCGARAVIPEAGAPLSCTPDVHVRPAAPYAVPRELDDGLVCYGWESPHPSKRHIIGLAPSIGAARQLHHVTLLQSDVAVSPIPGPCPADAMTSARPVYGWAPGAGGLELPAAAGLPYAPGTHFVVQLHYANPTHEAASDESGFDLCTTSELRPNDADVMAFGTTQITVPPRGSLSVDCSVPVPEGGATTHLFAAFPHMHRLGTAIRSAALPAGTGAPVDLGSVDSWNVGEQAWLPLDYTLRPGDVVTSKCSWKNPGDHAVGYGPTADDEMCFSFVMYFPRIEAPSWHWSLPALYSTCR